MSNAVAVGQASNLHTASPFFEAALVVYGAYATSQQAFWPGLW